MTGISKLSTEINLSELYNKLISSANDIKFIEFGEKYKGEIDKKNLKKREKKTKKYFYNQITIHIFIDYKDQSKFINMKIFNNGSLQMTGIKSKEMGQIAIDKIKEKIIKINENDIYKKSNLEIINYYISMINSDFNVNYKINRDKLNRIILDMGMYSSYEPCIYPGVNIKYYYKNGKQNGICNCEGNCDGSGKKDFCKKITILAFNSGAVMITGGKNIQHYEKIYTFILDLLIKNKNVLEHK